MIMGTTHNSIQILVGRLGWGAGGGLAGGPLDRRLGRPRLQQAYNKVRSTAVGTSRPYRHTPRTELETFLSPSPAVFS